MKNRLMRPSSVLLPLALLTAETINGDGWPTALLALFLVFQLLSLCAVDCFRNAAAREPGLRRVDRRFWGSFVMLIVAMALLAALYLLSDEKFTLNNMLILSVPLLINIEHLFEERLFTLNRRLDGNVLSLIANGLLFAGLMLDGVGGVAGPTRCFYTLAASGLGAVIAVITSLVIAPPKGFSLIPRNLGFAPRAIVQALLYPAAYLGLIELMPGHFDSRLIGFFGGYALWRLSRTLCRRVHDESRPLNLLLIAVTAAALIAATQISWMLDAAVCFCLALLCALIVFLHISWRNAAGMVLLAAGAICMQAQIMYAPWIAIGCGLIAVILNLKHAFLKRRTGHSASPLPR